MEVSLIQRLNDTVKYYCGTSTGVFNREVPFIQSVLYREASVVCILGSKHYAKDDLSLAVSCQFVQKKEKYKLFCCVFFFRVQLKSNPWFPTSQPSALPPNPSQDCNLTHLYSSIAYGSPGPRASTVDSLPQLSSSVPAPPVVKKQTLFNMVDNGISGCVCLTCKEAGKSSYSALSFSAWSACLAS